ncbi:MAG TPA: hypothetical protein VFS20_01195 [Longimicrobium sp.]|nr:hypothetical protein [Longimicrobium sp.]
MDSAHRRVNPRLERQEASQTARGSIVANVVASRFGHIEPGG